MLMDVEITVVRLSSIESDVISGPILYMIQIKSRSYRTLYSHIHKIRTGWMDFI